MQSRRLTCFLRESDQAVICSSQARNLFDRNIRSELVPPVARIFGNTRSSQRIVHLRFEFAQHSIKQIIGIQSLRS